ncbi:type II secretion system F family protein [Paraconexibacter antarcticus]|uniref:Type II secretion system F family protein n=1 Tax=Paraconexibacter antarcticus TaxID=2949664 RepID=A0ABY5DLZ7_9ACTN|nr:type II secretion system F family protein [Paraconexibacter antarcticus]UTI62539.1 type II secretion system F family protein [Paraconexibacter antarcticus]
MSTYVFKAMDLTGAKAGGEVEAESKQAVSDQLKQRGLIVLDIADKHKSRELNVKMFQRVKADELTVMTRQLATMVDSGMTILRALYVLEAQTENELLQRTIVEIRKDVEAGLALSEAMARHPKIFSPLFIAMTEAGETGGVLDAALLRVADQLEKEDSLRRQVKSAMAYPLVVIGFSVVVVLALVAFLIPVFIGVFKEFGGGLPAITQVTVTMSNVLTGYWYLLFGGVAALYFGFRKWKVSETGRRQWDRFRLRVPFGIGAIVQKVSLARWSRTLSALMGAGVPLLLALEITGRTAGNTVIEKAMGDVITSVRNGGTISGPLKDAPVFPGMVTHMLGVGEETGALDTMLSKVADFYEDQVDAAVKALTSILEPVMIVVVGSIVGFIVISMYLPLFKVYDAIK